jgi:hypothetical protein
MRENIRIWAMNPTYIKGNYKGGEQNSMACIFIWVRYNARSRKLAGRSISRIEQLSVPDGISGLEKKTQKKKCFFTVLLLQNKRRFQILSLKTVAGKQITLTSSYLCYIVILALDLLNLRS